MTSRIAIALALVACSKKDKPADDQPPATGSSTTKVKSGDRQPDETAPPGAGLKVEHQAIPEFTGSYTKVFAQLSEHETVIAFVRGCPQLTCDPGPWEPEQVAHTCPKAFIATAHVPSGETGTYKVSIGFAGPADNASTGTLEQVSFELTAVGNDGVEGTATQKTTESSVKGTFKAEVCPKT